MNRPIEKEEAFSRLYFSLKTGQMQNRQNLFKIFYADFAFNKVSFSNI